MGVEQQFHPRRVTGELNTGIGRLAAQTLQIVADRQDVAAIKDARVERRQQSLLLNRALYRAGLPICGLFIIGRLLEIDEIELEVFQPTPNPAIGVLQPSAMRFIGAGMCHDELKAMIGTRGGKDSSNS
ncbi:MAG: hypothetical protein ABW039_08715 [Sphingobium sp.]